MNKQFKSVYSAAELANLLGLSVETVRKHASQGKLPGVKVNNSWTFSHAELVKLPLIAAKLGKAGKNVTDVIFVLDRSGSMGHLMDRARENLQSQVETLKLSADANNEYYITILNFDDNFDVTMEGQDVRYAGNVRSKYLGASGWTKLNDAIARAISIANNRDDGKRSFLISIVTDGGENRSSTYYATLKGLVESSYRTDRFTFAYAGPAGCEGHASSIGIPLGSVTTWEQSYLGAVTLNTVTNNSLGQYTRSRSVGVTNTTSFYAQPVDANASGFANKLEKKLDALAPHQYKVERVDSKDPIVIKNFCEKKLGGFAKGKVYYQLTESEKVQDYKNLVVQDTATGKFYAGQKSALGLLGIPNFTGTVRIKPGNLGEFKVFVQSTSVNRKLQPGTAVVYLP